MQQSQRAALVAGILLLLAAATTAHAQILIDSQGTLTAEVNGSTTYSSGYFTIAGGQTETVDTPISDVYLSSSATLDMTTLSNGGLDLNLNTNASLTAGASADTSYNLVEEISFTITAPVDYAISGGLITTATGTTAGSILTATQTTAVTETSTFSYLNSVGLPGADNSSDPFTGSGTLTAGTYIYKTSTTLAENSTYNAAFPGESESSNVDLKLNPLSAPEPSTDALLLGSLSLLALSRIRPRKA